MALYFDTKLPTTVGRTYGDIEWHKLYPLLAISVKDDIKGGYISIYDHLKEETTDVETAPHPNVKVSSMSWHPKIKVIAIGLDSGEVIVWNHEESESFEGFRAHHAPISILKWNHTGNVLVSADTMGTLVVWKSDVQGHLQTKSHHDFRDPVCQIVFKRSPTVGANLNSNDKISSAERSLGQMTSWRPKTGRLPSRQAPAQSSENEEDQCFFIGLLGGTIYFVKESGSFDEVLTSGSAVKVLLYHTTQDILIVMTDACILGQFRVDSTGALKEIAKTKLSGTGDLRLSWIGHGTLAIISDELSIRLWEIDSGENCVLEPKESAFSPDETFCSIDFHPTTGILCCSTNKGYLAMWKEKMLSNSSDRILLDDEFSLENKWEWHNLTIISGVIKKALWCPAIPGILACNGKRDIYILREQDLCAHYGEKTSLLQISPNEATIAIYDQNLNFDAKFDIQIRGASTSKTHVAVWSTNKISSYEIGSKVPDNYRIIGSFACKCETLTIYEQSLFILEPEEIQVRTFQGTIKQTLSTAPTEGPPIILSRGGEHLSVGTVNGFLKLWHIGRREAKLTVQAKNLNDSVKNFGEIIDAKGNSNGTKIAFTIAKTNLMPDSRIYVWDHIQDKISSIEFAGNLVRSFYWEPEDIRFISVQIHKIPLELLKSYQLENEYSSNNDLTKKPLTGASVKSSSSNNNNRKNSKEIDKIQVQVSVDDEEPESLKYLNKKCDILLENGHDEIVSMYACTEKGILIQERRIIGEEYKQFLGVDVPYLLFRYQKASECYSKGGRGLDNNVADQSFKIGIKQELLRDFEGMEDIDSATRSALLSYNYYTTIGEIDKALQAVKKDMNNKKIWDNMAKSCIKTRRCDVALVCLAKTGSARQAMFVKREMKREPEVQVHVAMLAIQLNMIAEAEALYKECGRYDLLRKLFINIEQWDKAIEVCENHLRICLRTTYHQYAKWLERNKRLKEAICMYEKAETHSYEVPRMLLADPVALEKYIIEKKERELYHWYAQYLESQGETDVALKFYESAEDWLSHGRLLCYLGEIGKAIEIADKVNNRASCYNIAAVLEQKGEFEKAIHFYRKAGSFANAMKICKERNILDQLWTLALMAEPEDQADIARYFESKIDPPDYEKAIHLYHRSGYASKALDLAFSSQQYSTLQTVAKDLLNTNGKGLDPMLLKKCAAFFVANQQYERALDMLSAAHKYKEAMDLCVEYNLQITEEIAERLTAPKGEELDETTRIDLLDKMGESLCIQGNYHLAAKKYTQAGKKVQAMKALLKSGDTERILFYANHSRTRDIYLMAANYLQTTDWRGSPDIIQNIIHFYIKAKSPESLCAFYQAYAVYEIDENKSYERALKEYKNATKVLKDLVEVSPRTELVDEIAKLQYKMNSISKFIMIKETLSSDPDSAQKELKMLLQDPSINECINRADAYAILVEHYTRLKDYRIALKIMEEMRNFIPNSRNISRYISPETLQAIDLALNVNSQSIFKANSGSGLRGVNANTFELGGGDGVNVKHDDENDSDDEAEEEEELEDEVEDLENEDSSEDDDENSQPQLNSLQKRLNNQNQGFDSGNY